MRSEPFRPMMSRRRFLATTGAAGATLALGACGGDDDEATTAAAAAGSSETTAATAAGAETTAAAAGAETTAAGGAEPEKPDRIIMRAWGDPWSTTIESFPATTFTERTGIPVEFDLTDFPEIQTKVQQAVDAGQRPPVDVVWTTAPYAYAASAQGLSVALDPAVVTNYDRLTAVGHPDDGSTNWVEIYTYTLPVLYRTDLVTFPETGITWDELFDPKYEGQITLNLDPGLLVWPIAEILGINLETDDITPVFDRIAELRPNIGAIVPNDTALIEAIQSGEVSMGIAIIGDGLALRDAGVEVDWIVPSPGVSLSGDALYIPQGVPDNVVYWSQVFINEVIEAQNQTDFCAVVAVVPTNGEATPADYMQGDPAFPFTDEELEQYAIPIQNKLAAENLDDWTERFTVALSG